MNFHNVFRNVKRNSLTKNEARMGSLMRSTANIILLSSVFLFSANALATFSKTSGAPNSSCGGVAQDALSRTCLFSASNLPTYTVTVRSTDTNNTRYHFASIAISGNCRSDNPNAPWTAGTDANSGSSRDADTTRTVSRSVTLTGSSCTITFFASRQVRANSRSSWQPTRETRTWTEVWNALPSKTINKDSIPTSGNYLQEISINPTTSPGNDPVTTTPNSNCSFSNGKVKLTGNAGSNCVLTFTSPASSNYMAAAQVTHTIAIARANKTISLLSPVTDFGDVYETIIGTSFDVAAELVSDVSSNDDVVITATAPCTVPTNSKKTASVSVGVGSTCTITFNSPESTNFNAAQQKQLTVQIKKKQQTISVSGAPATSAVNRSLTVTAWAPDTTNAVSINASGACSTSGSESITFTPSVVGTCRLAFNVADNDEYLPATLEREIEIVKGTSSFVVEAPIDGLLIGYGTLEARGRVTQGDGVVLIKVASADGACATDQGASPLTIVTQGFGECEITYELEETVNYYAAEKQVRTIRVQEGAQTIIITTPAPGRAESGDTFTVAARSTSGLDVTIKADGACSGDGLNEVEITVDAVGECTVSYIQEGDENYAAATQLMQNVRITKWRQQINILRQQPTAAQNTVFEVEATLTYEDPDKPLIRISTNSECQVENAVNNDESGSIWAEIKVIGRGICTVYYRVDETQSYMAATAQRNTRAVILTGGSDIAEIWKPNVLFTTGSSANDIQPITSAPTVSRDPQVRSKQPNVMVMFGTGKYLEELDLTSSQRQTMYAVHDRGDVGLTRYETVSGGARKLLEERTLVTVEVTDTNGNVHVLRKISSAGNEIDWRYQYGWFMDLEPAVAGGSGAERAVFRPVTVNNTLIFSTVIPQVGACTGATKGGIIQMDWTNGRASEFATYDANMDGKIDDSDIGYVGNIVEGISQVNIMVTNDGSARAMYSKDDEIHSNTLPPAPTASVFRLGWEEKRPYELLK